MYFINDTEIKIRVESLDSNSTQNTAQTISPQSDKVHCCIGLDNGTSAAISAFTPCCSVLYCSVV